MARKGNFTNGAGLTGSAWKEPRRFDQLVSTHKNLVNHIVRRMVKDTGDAEDIYQEVFLKVYEALPGFRFESKMSTWIASITYKTCVNHLLKKKEVVFGKLEEADPSVSNGAGRRTGRTLGQGIAREACLGAGRGPGNFTSVSPLPDQDTERAEIAQRLETEINRMPAQYRAILTLFHLEEMTYREIGDVMDLPEGTVKSYLFRARKLLRERLTATLDVEDFMS